MNSPPPLLAAFLLALLAGCASNVKPNKPIHIETGQHSPVRTRLHDWPVASSAEEAEEMGPLLLLPPLGVADEAPRNRFHEELYAAGQRRLATPLQTILPNSAYAPYIEERNLVRDDGSLDTGEIAFIGALMNCRHVIVPYVRELRPYHPQRIDLRIYIISSGGSKVRAEVVGVFDASDRDVVEYFIEHSRQRKRADEDSDDLFFRIKSPAAFQGFVADTSATVMAEKLSL